MKDGLNLKDVVLLGRTFAEYSEYFSLCDFDLKREKVLDMGAGVSSFCAEACQRGYSVLAADPIYGLPASDLSRKCEADLDEVVRQLPRVLHNYNWEFYRDVEHLRECRERAYRAFLPHYVERPKKYVRACLPSLPFGDGEFTLALVSYFLFLYDDRLDYEFHRRSLIELARVTSGEVRVYPLTNLRAEKSSMVDVLMANGGRADLNFEVRKVEFEFLRNADEMLIVRQVRDREKGATAS